MANRIVTAAVTGETIIEEVADVEMPVVEETPQQTVEERVAALETLYLQAEGII